VLWCESLVAAFEHVEWGRLVGIETARRGDVSRTLCLLQYGVIIQREWIVSLSMQLMLVVDQLVWYHKRAMFIFHQRHAAPANLRLIINFLESCCKSLQSLEEEYLHWRLDRRITRHWLGPTDSARVRI